MPEYNTVEKLIAGAYDLHMHAAPSPFDRIMDDFELLEEAGQAKMGGIMLKSHYESTAARAEIANRHCGSCTRAYGGIALNWPVGSLNPYAVENALKRGARIVWLPTRDAANSLTHGNMDGDFFDRPGIKVTDEYGHPRQEVLEIMEIVRRYDAALATGHISPEESLAVCEEGVRHGTRMVLTHPEYERTRIDANAQKKLADQGVYIEKCWYNIAEHACNAEEMAEHIRIVGANHCFLSTDRGQKGREHPVQALGMFIKALMEQGVTGEELYAMTHTVPMRVLGL